MRNWIPMLCLVLLLGAACSGPSGQTGSLTVNLKDGPYADAQAMLVTFSNVSAHHADEDWQTLKFAGDPAPTTLTCDLKKLVNAFDVLGTGQLLAGHYTQLRVHGLSEGPASQAHARNGCCVQQQQQSPDNVSRQLQLVRVCCFI